MKKYFLSAIAIALLASCDGTVKQNSQSSVPDTFITANGTSSEVNTGEYASTGDASLLDVSMPANLSHSVLHYKAITIYYSDKYRVPACVAYEMTSTQATMADAPDAERRENYNFNRDTKVARCPEWWEYKETGYDRGHMAPAMDMRWDKEAMEQCFLMTNICPQDHELNDGEWRHMEEAIHTWARRTDRLVIFTGPVLRNDVKRTGKHHDIAVPTKFYKVVYDVKQNKAIAFLFKNEKATGSWTNYAVTVDDVEAITGIDFLASLPDDVETAIESRQSIKSWPRYTPRR